MSSSLLDFRPLGRRWTQFWRPVRAARYYAGLLVRIECLCQMWEADDLQRPKNQTAESRAALVRELAAKWRSL